MHSKKDALQTVHFGAAANEPKTRYQQAQEDRMNDNFRLLMDMLLAVANVVASSESDGIAILTNGIRSGKVDPDSTATEFKAQIPGITSYYDGLTVLLKNGVVTSAAGFTIDINGLGARRVYNNMAAATAETTIFNVNYTMLFIYDSTRVEGGGWICYRGYDSNSNTIGYQLRTNASSRQANYDGRRYRLWFSSADGTKWVCANKSTATNATSARGLDNTTKIDPFGPIVYNSTNGSANEGSNLPTNTLWQQYTFDLRYSQSPITLTASLPVYVKCTPNADGSANLDSFVQALPSTDDGKIYIFLGIAYSATSMELYANHPVYQYKNGALRLYTGP